MMKLFSLLRRACVCAFFSVGLASQAHAGIPVIDAGNLAQALQQVVQLTQQLEQMKAQYAQMKQQYASLTGSRGLGLILNDEALRTYLPDDLKDLYDTQKALGKSTQEAAKKALESAGLTITKDARGKYLTTLATNSEVTRASYDATLKRLQNIQKLMQQANETGDLKASADLQNRLQAEQASVQADNTRLQLVARLQEAEKAMAEETRRREYRSSILNN